MTTDYKNKTAASSFMPRQFYEAKLHSDEAQAKVLAGRAQRLVLLRTASFFVLIFALAAAWDGQRLGAVISILALVLFIVFVRRHQDVKKKTLLCLSHLACVKACIDRLSDQWMTFPDDGHEFLTEKIPQGADLPLFGHASLYQYLCCARTKEGRKELAHLLAPYPETIKEILARQQAVKELAQDPARILNWLSISHLLPFDYDAGNLCTAMERLAIKKNKTLHILSFLLPLAAFTSFFAAGLDLISYAFSGLLFLLQFLLTILLAPRHNRLLSPLYRLPEGLPVYQDLFALLTSFAAESPRLRQLQAGLKKNGGAVNGLARLSQIASRVSLRRNIFVFLVANTLFLWDLHSTSALAKWQQQYASSLRGWLAAWSRTEALLSLAIMATTREHYCWPEIMSGAPRLQGENIKPPLIAEKKAIANPASFTAGTAIITGSNMSGKTTYMRTLALSAILAYAGAPVCADSFVLTPMSVYTSIHVSDDPSRGISTFYAEILRIKQMVEACRQKQPLFLCIDEIFKGTNSADRITGAAETLRHLTQPWCLTLVTTHDFELCNLTAPNHLPIHNYHFEEHYKEGKIHFDFKIREGRCQTTNARYLLKMAGILA